MPSDDGVLRDVEAIRAVLIEQYTVAGIILNENDGSWDSATEREAAMIADCTLHAIVEPLLARVAAAEAETASMREQWENALGALGEVSARADAAERESVEAYERGRDETTSPGGHEWSVAYWRQQHDAMQARAERAESQLRTIVAAANTSGSELRQLREAVEAAVRTADENRTVLDDVVLHGFSDQKYEAGAILSALRSLAALSSSVPTQPETDEPDDGYQTYIDSLRRLNASPETIAAAEQAAVELRAAASAGTGQHQQRCEHGETGPHDYEITGERGPVDGWRCPGPSGVSPQQDDNR